MFLHLPSDTTSRFVTIFTSLSLDVPHGTQELRIPCLVADSVLAFALHRAGGKDAEQAELVEAKRVALEHESDKQAKKAQEAATRAEQKAMQMRANDGAGKHPKQSKHPIQQPDKNKKSK